MEDLGEFFGIEEEQKEEFSPEDFKPALPQLFDWINSITYDKNELILNQDYPPEQIEKSYPAFQVNKGLSMGMDMILIANEMNRLSHLSKDAQYRYYLNKIRKMKRRNSWAKADKMEDLNLIAQRYQCNRNIAKQYLKILSETDLQEIRDMYNVNKKPARKKKG